VWAPLERLVDADGVVILMGVGLTRLTLGHLAEERAGRRPFLRWARMRDGTVGRVQVGSCSEGFDNLATGLHDVIHEQVGSSWWMVLSARDALRQLTDAITGSPAITKCGDPACERCRDAVVGGPLE
jgi:aminoglycoside 3-N-acetyltransferase